MSNGRANSKVQVLQRFRMDMLLWDTESFA